MNIYRITPVDGDRIFSTTTVFERTYRGPRGWTVSEEYTGPVFSSEIPFDGTVAAVEGIANGVPVSSQFEFDDWYSEAERDRIRAAWSTQGREILVDDRWKIEEDYLRITGPVQVEEVHD